MTKIKYKTNGDNQFMGEIFSTLKNFSVYIVFCLCKGEIFHMKKMKLYRIGIYEVSSPLNS